MDTLEEAQDAPRARAENRNSLSEPDNSVTKSVRGNKPKIIGGTYTIHHVPAVQVFH